MSIGYKIRRLVRKWTCKYRGHTGLCVRSGLHRPSAKRLLEEGRCARCGVLRWGAKD